MQYHLRYCLDCLADQETDQQGACTDCTSIRLTELTYNPGTVVLGDGDAYTEYGTARPWQEQWYRAKEHFKKLNAVYAPGGYRSDAIARAAVEDFFEHCLRVGDWLWGDQEETHLDKAAVQDFIKNDRSLKVCKGVANAAKHRERDWKGSINAVVRRVQRREDNSASVDIEWWMHGHEGGRRTVDALVLAEGCMTAWKEYLKHHNLRLWEVSTRRNSA